MAADVSIVIPCYNGEAYIQEAIGSAARQDGLDADIEILVVDDGSIDGSVSLIEAMAAEDDRVRIVRQANAGVARARNAGLRECSPDSRFVLFLDADDVLASDALMRLRRQLEESPTLVGAVGACSRIDGEGRTIATADGPFEAYVVEFQRVRKVVAPSRLTYWHVLPINPISTPGQCLIRRSALSGRAFDPAVVPCEDWDLWLRLSRQGAIGVVPHEVLQYRDHVQSASKRYALMHEQRGAVYAKQREVISEAERADLRAAWRFGMYGFDARICVRWARECLARGNLIGSGRYLLRSARYAVRYMAASFSRHPRL